MRGCSPSRLSGPSRVRRRRGLGARGGRRRRTISAAQESDRSRDRAAGAARGDRHERRRTRRSSAADQAVRAGRSRPRRGRRPLDRRARDRAVDRLPPRAPAARRTCATTARRWSSRSATPSRGRASCSSSSISRSTAPASFSDHLDAHGEGFHHVGKYVDDQPPPSQRRSQPASRRFRAHAGFGAEGDGAFAYFQPPGVPLIVELIAAPRVRIEPEFVYPLEHVT